VIIITASGSPLALTAKSALAHGANQILLAADHPEDADRYSPMVSRLLHLLIIDILTTGVALRLGSANLRPMLQEVKKALRQRRYAEPPGGAYSTDGTDGTDGT
jgi:RpiR family carbohydrate utilization transcriptional regulator